MAARVGHKSEDFIDPFLDVLLPCTGDAAASQTPMVRTNFNETSSSYQRAMENHAREIKKHTRWTRGPGRSVAAAVAAATKNIMELHIFNISRQPHHLPSTKRTRARI